MKRLVAYDLDGTLAESKQPIDPETAALLARLTKVALVAVISGGDWPQFEEQLIGKLPDDTDLDRLFLLPASGTKLYRFRARWDQVYAELFSEEERKRILKALASTVAEQGLGAARSWGDRIEDRGSQITFSGLGQRAPLDAKQAWDADFAKRKRLQAALTRPGFSRTFHPADGARRSAHPGHRDSKPGCHLTRQRFDEGRCRSLFQRRQS